MKFRKVAKKAGIVLLYVGLLLLLVSFISQLQVNRSSGGGSLLKGESRTALRSLELCPFQEMEVTAKVEEGGVLTVYLLETDNIFASSNETSWTSNSTALQEFLEQNPDRIIWKDQIENGEYERSYFSTKFMNAVVVFHNPTSEIAHLQYEGELKFFGSTDETRYVAVCATPLGALLILPWQVNQWKQRKKK
ncbi:MAG: hypothetical protein CW716_12690 [Candidatus Bathyarchaeum sp.]|nr:MAG: hypothetical protein CW716_12690 [Candidatus Bathyarchaeum sp.]